MNITLISPDKMESEKNESLVLPTDLDILGAPVFYTLQGVVGLEGLLAIVGNFTTILCISRYRLLWRRNACRLITSLAFADFLMGIASFSTIAMDVISASSPSAYNSMCRVFLFFSMLSGFGNVYSYFMMTCDRFLYIERPVQYASFVTHRRVLQAIAVTWVASLLQTCLTIVWTHGTNEQQLCQIFNEDVFRRPGVYFSLLMYFLTILLIGPIYGKIIYTTWILLKTLPDISNSTIEAQAIERKKLRERKLTLAIGLVFGVYILCYMPIGIYVAILSQIDIGPHSFGIVLGRRILVLVYRLQSVLNPFLYGKKSSMMKTAYRKMLCRRSEVSNNFEMN